MIYCQGRLKSNRDTLKVSKRDGSNALVTLFYLHYLNFVSNVSEALELLSNPQAEGGLGQIVDAIFRRPTPDIVELTYDTDTAVKANHIGTDKRTPTPSEGLLRGMSHWPKRGSSQC